MHMSCLFLFPTSQASGEEVSIETLLFSKICTTYQSVLKFSGSEGGWDICVVVVVGEWEEREREITSTTATFLKIITTTKLI